MYTIIQGETPIDLIYQRHRLKTTSFSFRDCIGSENYLTTEIRHHIFDLKLFFSLTPMPFFSSVGTAALPELLNMLGFSFNKTLSQSIHYCLTLHYLLVNLVLVAWLTCARQSPSRRTWYILPVILQQLKTDKLFRTYFGFSVIIALRHKAHDDSLSVI